MVKHIESEAEFNKVLAKPLVLVKFSAEWCGPCKAVAPAIDKLEPSFPAVAFVDVDVDQFQGIAQRFAVTSMPTFVFVHNGAEVDRTLGGNVAEITENLRKLAGKGSTPFGAGRRVGGGGPAPSAEGLRELRNRALARAAERRQSGDSKTAEDSTTAKDAKAAKDARPGAKSAPSSPAGMGWGEWLSNLRHYAYLYVATLLSFDAKARAAALENQR